MKKILLTSLLLCACLFGEEIKDEKVIDFSKIKLNELEKKMPDVHAVIKDYFNAKFCTSGKGYEKFITIKDLDALGSSQQYGILIASKLSLKSQPYIYENIINNYKFMNCYNIEQDFKTNIEENPYKKETI